MSSKIKERREKIEQFLKDRNEKYTKEEITKMGQQFINEMKEIGEKYFPNGCDSYEEDYEEMVDGYMYEVAMERISEEAIIPISDVIEELDLNIDEIIEIMNNLPEDEH